MEKEEIENVSWRAPYIVLEEIENELKKVKNWEISEIIRTLDNNVSWRAPYIVLENFENAEEINKQKLVYNENYNKYKLAQFLLDAFAKRQYYIVDFRMRFFGDEGGPSCEFTLVTRNYDISEENYNESILYSSDIRYKIHLVPL